jgi:hypothetical protein
MIGCSDGSEESEDLLTKYKVAYERTRLQRDFYERAASSLVYQVDVLGGDPMQASRQASKGEDLDPKNARVSLFWIIYSDEIFNLGYSIEDLNSLFATRTREFKDKIN